MTVTVITQCRLCARKFEELLVMEEDCVLLSARPRTHPREDGCPWCPDCLERVSRVAERLLGAVPGMTEALAG